MSSSSSSKSAGKSDGKSTASSKLLSCNSPPYVPVAQRSRQAAAAAGGAMLERNVQLVPALSDSEFPSLGEPSGGSGRKNLPASTKSKKFVLADALPAVRAENEPRGWSHVAEEAYAALKEENDPLKLKFLELLFSHDQRGGKGLYQLRALEVAATKCYTFRVDFVHLLQPEYLELGIKVWKDHESTKTFSYLREVVVNFLKIHCIIKEEVQVAAADVYFDNFPIKMQPFSDYKPEDLVVADQSQFGQEHQLVSTRFVGRQIQINAHKEAYEQHSARRSWGGQFTSKDIYIIQFSSTKIWVRINASFVVFSYENIVLDLKKIHSSTAGQYKLCGSSPPHFECLDADIDSLTAATAAQSSVLRYFPRHVAFMTDGANKVLTEELHNATGSVWMDREVFDGYKSVFERELDDDWRPDYAASSDPLLRKVYHHDNRTIVILKDQKAKEHAAVQKEQGQMGVVEPQLLLQTQLTEAQSQQVHVTPQNQSKFKGNLKGKLDYKRHLNVHVGDYRIGKRPWMALFQSEAYAGKKNCVLGDIFTELFKGKQMKLELHLSPLLELYFGTRDTDDELMAS